jgi:hypothetical protein
VKIYDFDEIINEKQIIVYLNDLNLILMGLSLKIAVHQIDYLPDE